MADKENKVDQGKVKADAEKLAGGQSTGPENVPAATPAIPAQPAQRATPADPRTGTAATPAQSATPAQPGTPAAHEAQGAQPTQPGTHEAKAAQPLSAEDATNKIEDQALKQYGPGYVKAVKGGQQTTFSQRAWDLLGDNKEGWKAETKKPKEVEDLEAKKAASDTGK